MATLTLATALPAAAAARSAAEATTASAAIPTEPRRALARSLDGGAALETVHQAKLTASDGEGGDELGWSVAISGDTALVGAYREDVDGSPDQGAAYVFVRDGGIWTEQAKLTASDGEPGDELGYAVAISGDTVLVGAPVAGGAGAVYLFERAEGVWIEHAKLVASDGAAEDGFGGAVALSGDIALVGAPSARVASTANQGAAYVFLRDEVTWVEQAKLTASDGGLNNWFGYAVALEGNTSVVGARGAGSANRGAAYVFVDQGAGWFEQAKLIASDAASDAQFGYAVDLSGDTVLVAAEEADVDGSPFQGAAYIFTRDEELWTESAKLTASDGMSSDRFGSSVSLINDQALVGARWNNGRRGAAYLFAREGDAWSERAKLTAADGAGNDHFGRSVALEDGTSLVGVHGAAINGNSTQGAAYVYVDVEPSLFFEPMMLDLGDVLVGSVGSPDTVALRNTTGAAATGLSFSDPGSGFELDSSGCGTVLPDGESCSVGVTFAPSEMGPIQVPLEATSGEGGTATVALVGRGVLPDLSLEPPSLDLGRVELGFTSSDHVATLWNTGTSSATGLSFSTVGSDFAANGCTTLAAGRSCEVRVTFTPEELGPSGGTLQIDSNEGVSITVDLDGTGVDAGPQLAIAPSSLEFGVVPVAGTNIPQSAVLLNTGVADAGGIDVESLDGFHGSPDACGILAAGESCEIVMRFEPEQPGPADAVLEVGSDQGVAASLAVAGEGVQTLGGDTHLVSRASGVDGDEVNCSGGCAFTQSVSGDGRYVAFRTFATNLHPDSPICIPDPLLGPRTCSQIFVRDVETQETALVSRASGEDGAIGNGDSAGCTPRGKICLATNYFDGFLAISGDGRFVAFDSWASNLHPDAPDDTSHVYVRDLETHTTLVVSRASGPNGVVGNGTSILESISADGRYVTFRSAASNLHPDDSDDETDVYVRDMATHDTILVSRASGAGGVKSNGESLGASISGDGRRVSFWSRASNLHPDAPPSTAQVYVRNLRSHETVLVSRASGLDGEPADGDSGFPPVSAHPLSSVISADGRFVAFNSPSSNLHDEPPPICNDGGPSSWDRNCAQLLVRDLETHETIVVSRANGTDGELGDNDTADVFKPGFSISANGRFVTFATEGRNLHPDADDFWRPVFVRDLQTDELIYASRASGPAGDGNEEPAFRPASSADGRYVVFDSRASNLHPDATEDTMNVFLRDAIGPPDLSVTPYLFDLGEAMVGETGSPVSMTVHNVGTRDRTIEGVSPSAPPFSAVGGTCVAPPFTLSAGESCTFDFAFSPETVGPARAVLHVRSDSKRAPHVVFLGGTGVGALRVTPAPLDLGAVKIGESTGPGSVTLANIAAEGELMVSDVSTPAAPFAPVGGTCGTPPFSLAAGASCTLDYTFGPTAVGPAEATVTVVSDSLGSPDTLILQGTGLPLAPPVVSVEPAGLSSTLLAGQTETRPLTLANLGEEMLAWSVNTAESPAAGAGPLARRSPSPSTSGGNGRDDRAAAGEPGAATMDLASVLGAPLQGVRPTAPAGGVVDCDGEPGIVVHDDGTVENAYSGSPSAVEEIAFIDRFTPSVYPASFRAICVAFASFGPSTLDFEILAFDDDGPGGSPGTELGALPARAEGLPIGVLDLVWHSFDISSLFLSIAEGSVYIGVRWAPSSPDNVFIAVDESTENPPGFAGGYFGDDVSDVWNPIESVSAFQGYRSLFVRAVESEPVPCALASTIGWLDVAPGSGETAGGDSSVAEVTFDATGLEPGVYEAQVCVFSNDPERPLVEVPVSLTVQEGVFVEVEFEPSSLDFGEVEVGQTSAPQVGSLINRGTADATELVLSLAGGDGFEADTSGCGESLPAGASCSVSVIFGPREPGSAEAVVQAGSAEGASATLTVTGTGYGEAAFTPMGLEVDAVELVSDGNRVLEPGEVVEVAPAWRNDGSLAASALGTASDLSGPPGATYTLALDEADYGLVEPGATAGCEAMGVCYQVGVHDMAVRPATHWMARFDETLQDDTMETWSLHIGDSFADVPRSSPFYRAVETLLHHEVTGGCSDGEYCPAGTNSRGQMAVFLLRAAEGSEYAPPVCVAGGERFTDVPHDSLLCPWIEELAAREITSGCGDGNYCPGTPVTRGQMAVFLLKAYEGAGYTPPSCTGEFSDVECSLPFAAWIEELAERGVTGGCRTDPPAYCPMAAVSRAQMAVFVTRAFGLTLYGP